MLEGLFTGLLRTDVSGIGLASKVFPICFWVSTIFCNAASLITPNQTIHIEPPIPFERTENFKKKKKKLACLPGCPSLPARKPSYSAGHQERPSLLHKTPKVRSRKRNEKIERTMKPC